MSALFINQCKSLFLPSITLLLIDLHQILNDIHLLSFANHLLACHHALQIAFPAHCLHQPTHHTPDCQLAVLGHPRQINRSFVH